MRTFLVTLGILTIGVNPTQAQRPADTGIRAFRVHVPERDIADLKRRLQQTRWPDKETVNDASQGAQLANMRELVGYWGGSYDWRKAEAKLNSLPQYTTDIDGVRIHFIQVRSREKNALPLLVMHGWPGSVFEQLKLVGPLTDPVAHGGRAEDAFDVVIPSMPGFGFSSRPTTTGWDPDRIARSYAELMKRLGYSRWVAQGGDLGALVANSLGRQAPQGLLAIHSSLPATLPPELGPALASGMAPAGLSDKERVAFQAVDAFNKNARAYAFMMTTRPQAVGYGLTDSPAGLAGWMLVHTGFDKWQYGRDPRQSPTRDDVLDNFSLYWLTNTAVSAAREYWENGSRSVLSAAAQKTADIKVPVAITAFPDEIYVAPESWARRAYPTLLYFHEAAKGGHFAAWEQPQVFSAELRAAFAPIRSRP
ncbi:epoxide hydrolase 1 [Sphingomonas sp. BN140010]|uniref:Epoxide hydrolase 1 n=1 Tax=Sphingomonas arvum TaxID=2992113 RepID=A0ABT3JHB4_9SPHN|nr:epoxide hydrolase [Sphingomonas sp. BN140010]MCW3798465.1 epoxide hydrolase 1 [Sphingomonas sp. BN140010]